MIRGKVFRYGWTLLAAGLALTAITQIMRGLPVETNILELLPETRRDALATLAVERYNDTFARNVAFLVSADTEAESLQATTRLIALLESSDLLEQISGRIDEEQALDFYRLYQAYRANFVSRKDFDTLLNEEFDLLKERVIASFISPMPGFNADALETDPLLLFTGFLSGIANQPGKLQLQDGIPTVRHEGRIYRFITARITGDPFVMDYQQRFSGFYQQTEKILVSEFNGVSLLSAGMVHSAHAGASQAKTEISTIGFGSLIGILVLFILGFRSTRPLAYALIPITVGIMAAITVCALVFESIHIMTLVFGASLIGVSIDYSLHFFTKQAYHKPVLTREECLSHIMPGITLGLITSVIGYTAFFITPFPGLRQMALFSATGLFAAYCCVIFWFPVLPSLKPCADNHPALKIAGRIINFWNGRRALLLIPLALFAGFQIITAPIDDDIRSLDNSPPSMREIRRQFEIITGIKPAGQFFVVSGETPQAVLEHEEALTDKLDALIQNGALRGFHAISNRIPSAKRQQLNYLAVRDALLQDGALHTILNDIGFDAQTIADYKAAYAGQEPAILDFETWRASGAADDSLWLGNDAGEYATVVYLIDVEDPGAIVEASRHLEHIRFIDQIADISHVFTRYRQLTNKVVIAAYSLVLLMLITRYGPRKALGILIPPALAGVCAFAAIGLSDQPLTLFNSLALLLVLGIGIDYTIFLAENKGELNSTMTAVIYSAMTTVLSFGLLALSDTPALKSIGVTVLCGITVALLLAPVSRAIGKSPTSGSPD